MKPQKHKISENSNIPAAKKPKEFSGAVNQFIETTPKRASTRSRTRALEREKSCSNVQKVDSKKKMEKDVCIKNKISNLSTKALQISEPSARTRKHQTPNVESTVTNPTNIVLRTRPRMRALNDEYSTAQIGMSDTNEVNHKTDVAPEIMNE